MILSLYIPKRGQKLTNGDVIKAAFPEVKFYDMAFTVHATAKVTSNGVKGGISYDFWKDWWNAPYKEERGAYSIIPINPPKYKVNVDINNFPKMENDPIGEEIERQYALRAAELKAESEVRECKYTTSLLSN